MDVLMDLMALGKQYGPLVLAIGFFLWQGWVRECRVNKRVETLEDGQRNILLPLIEKCAEVIAQNTSMMGRMEKALDDRFSCPWQPVCATRK